MKKIFSIILIVFVFLFVVFFGHATYQYYVALHSDDPITPYVTVESGALTLVRGTVAIDMVQSERYNLAEGDRVLVGKNGFSVISWPDHSTTRL